MKKYLITIDYIKSQQYEIDAKDVEQAEDNALAKFEQDYPKTNPSDYWVGDTEIVE